MTEDLAGSTADSSQPKPGDSSQLLKKAAGNIRHLIAYLAGEGRDFDDLNCKGLLQAVENVDALNPQDEAEFWKNYSAIVKAAFPARIEAVCYAESVEQSATKGNANTTGARMAQQDSSLRKIRFLSWFAFGCTLLCLAYLSFTESALQRNQAIAEEYSNLNNGIVKGSAIEGAYQAIQNAGADSQAQGGSAETSAANFSATPIPERLAHLVDTRKASLVASAGYNDKMLRFCQFKSTASTSSDSKQGERARSEQGEPIDNSVFVTQQSINALISRYMLPVLAALLGVTVFILRTSSAEMRSLSFRPYELGAYSNRLALGVVGGIAISWFISTDKAGVLSSLTPAALAFIVGYSVEVLYNILDALVKALGANEK